MSLFPKKVEYPFKLSVYLWPPPPSSLRRTLYIYKKLPVCLYLCLLPVCLYLSMPTQTQCKKCIRRRETDVTKHRILHYSTPDYHGKDITVTHPNKGQLKYRFSHMAQ